MRSAGRRINPIDAILAVLLPLTAIGMYVEFNDSVSPQTVIRAAYSGDVVTVFENVDEDFDFLARGDHDRTLLHAAAVSGNADMVAFILANGGGVAIDTHDFFGYTPVHLSMGIRTPLGQVRNATFPTFIEHGIDPNLETRFGEPLLAAAIDYRREEMAVLLVEAQANVELGNVDGAPMITTVAAGSMTDLLQALLERGVSANTEPPHKPPLAYAIVNRDAETVRLLLEYGADPNAWIEWPPIGIRARSYLGGRRGRGGSSFRGPKLTYDHVQRGVPVQFRPLDLVMWYDLKCAIVLIEYGARAEVFPRVLIDSLTW